MNANGNGGPPTPPHELHRLIVVSLDGSEKIHSGLDRTTAEYLMSKLRHMPDVKSVAIERES